MTLPIPPALMRRALLAAGLGFAGLTACWMWLRAPMLTNGPMCALGSITASPAMTAEAWMPAGCAATGSNSAAIRATAA